MGNHQIILTSPEMCLEHPKFSALFRNAEFTQRVSAVVVDEAHCISQWGEGFHKKFSELGTLRSYVPTSVPFLVTSATLPPLVLDEVRQNLTFSQTQTFFVNLGNERLNITPIVCRMHGAANLDNLTFVLDKPSTHDRPFHRMIIFFNSREL